MNLPREITKMQSQEIKGFLDHQAPWGKQALWDLLAQDFLAHQDREVNQEFQATRV